MFNNIGKKIKGLAKFLFWAGSVSCIIYAIIGFTEWYADEDIVFAWCLLLIGPIASWLSSLVLYGFGELVDKVTNIEKHLCPQPDETTASDEPSNTVANEQKFISPQPNEVETTASDESSIAIMNKQKFICPRCGEDVYFGETQCKKCGQTFDWNQL